MAVFEGTSSLHSGSYIGRLTIEETSVNQTNNTSTLTWTLEMDGTNGYYYRGYSTSVSVKIDGVEVAPSANITVYMTPDRAQANHYYTFWSGQTTVVGHNTDGTKTVSIAVKISRPESGGTTYLPGVINITGEMALTTIHRTSSLVIPKMYVPVNPPGEQAVNAYLIRVVKEQPGHKNYITFEIFGGGQKVTGECVGHEEGGVITPSALNSFMFSVSSSWIAKNRFANSAVVTGTFHVTTYKSNDPTDVETGDIPFEVEADPAYVPGAPSVTVGKDPATAGEFATGSVKVKLTCSATPYGGQATISKFKITGDDTGEATATNNAAVYTTPIFSTKGVKTFNVVAVDSRGRESTATTVTATYKNYSSPSITVMTLERGVVEGGVFTPLISGSSIRVTLEAKVSFSSNNGTFTVVCKDGDTTVATRTLGNKTGSVVFDTTSDNVEYTIIASFVDDYGGTAERTDTMPEVSVPMNINPNKNNPGVAFGGMSAGNHEVQFFSPWKLYLPEVEGTDIGSAVAAGIGQIRNLMKQVYHGTSSQGASTQAKTVTVDSTLKTSTLDEGIMVAVYFENANTATSPTLNVNSTGNKSITRYTKWQAGEVVIFYYYSGSWVAIGNYRLAGMSGDSTHRVVTDTQISTWDSKSDFSGDYNDLTNKPTLATVATTGDYDDLIDKPTLATVATTGDYDDLTDKPTIPSQGQMWFGTSSTAGGTATKAVTITGFPTTLVNGLTVAVRFANANTVASPKLSINSGTAVSIIRYGTTAPSTSAATSWQAGTVVLMCYYNSHWYIVNWLNTTYSAMTSAEITAGTGTTARLITPASLKTAIQTWDHVKSVNGQTGAVSLTIPTVPTDVSAFNNDAGYLTLSDLPIWDGSVT